MSGLLNALRPGHYVEHVCDIDCAALKAEGIRLIILDLDNTLLPWKSSEVSDEVKGWVASAKEAGMHLTILSNTHYPRRLSRIANDLGISSVAHAFKPLQMGFARAARLAHCEPRETVVVGDQLLTDMLGGNLAGMRTILVKPMDTREFAGTKISRAIERLVISRLSGDPESGTKPEATQSQTKDAK